MPRTSSTVSSKAPWSFSMFCIQAASAVHASSWGFLLASPTQSNERQSRDRPPTASAGLALLTYQIQAFSRRRSRKKCPRFEDRISTTCAQMIPDVKKPCCVEAPFHVHTQHRLTMSRCSEGWLGVGVGQDTPLFKV